MKKILKSCALLALLAAAAVGYARFIEPNLLISRKTTAQDENITAGLRAVFFTDTHFGRYYSAEKASDIVNKINGQHPDIVLFGGDLFDNYARDLPNMDISLIQSEFRKIEAPYGKFAVFGNHDYGGGASAIYEDFMTGGGFTVLKNDAVYINDFQLTVAGFDDHLLGNPLPDATIPDDGQFHLLLAHEPVISGDIHASGSNFLFTGHTHGGQVTIPGLTGRLTPAGSGKFIKGRYSAADIGSSDNIEMYTSSGIGMTKYPVRFLNIPEIVVLDLTKSSS